MSRGLIDPLKKCSTTATCLIFGHDVRDAGEDDQHYSQKGFVKGGRGGTIRQYFKGALLICARPSCGWKELIGPKEPYKTTIIQDGVETVIKGDAA